MPSITSAVMKMQFEADDMSVEKRDNHIVLNLSKMEKSGDFERK